MDLDVGSQVSTWRGGSGFSVGSKFLMSKYVGANQEQPSDSIYR